MVLIVSLSTDPAMRALARRYGESPLGAAYATAQVERLADLRTLAEGVEMLRFALAHRGSYRRGVVEPTHPALAELGVVASVVIGRTLSIVGAELRRFVRGDYSLLADDAGELETIELSVDLSGDATGEGELVYTHRGEAFLAPPQLPGGLVLATRSATVGRYERYLTHRVGEREIVRLRVTLR